MVKVIQLLTIVFLLNYPGLSEANNNYRTFSKVDPSIPLISEIDYLNFLRISIIDQPEYLYSVSTVKEKNMSVKFAKRSRLPDLSMRIINDSVLKRDIKDQSSVRKRRDDSFDAAIELSQPIYSGGAINARIGMARNDLTVSNLMRDKTVSEQIVEANKIYLQAIKSDILYNYGLKIVRDVQPFLDRVKDRVESGIADPMDLAVFSIRFNDLYSKVQVLKTQKNRDIAMYEYFFKTDYKNVYLPNVFVSSVKKDLKRVGYDVELAILGHKGKELETTLTKSEFRPQFGFNTRYTKYDLKDDENESDIRGGIYFSLPLFTFGRAKAKVSSYEAKAAAAKMYIDIERKIDDGREAEVINVIESSLSIREDVYNTFSDTKKQRGIIEDRLEIINFAPEAYVDTGFKELNQLEILLITEINLLDGYMQFLHQNRALNSFIMIKP
jgi:hypothetical protein